MQGMRILGLESNRIGEVGAYYLGQMQELTTLNLDFNQIGMPELLTWVE